MTIEVVTEFFWWALVINVGILTFSTIMLIAMRGFITKLHGGMFGLDAKDLARAYFQYLGQFKIAIIVLNITPYIVLRIIA